jgi:hypothetical protein
MDRAANSKTQTPGGNRESAGDCATGEDGV